MYKGKLDKAKNVLERKFGGIEGYDVETELAVLVGTVEKQKQYNAEMKLTGRFAIFKGLHLKRFLIASWPKVGRLSDLMPRSVNKWTQSDSPGVTAVCRSVGVLLVLGLLFQTRWQ